MARKGGLNERQKKFADFYIESGKIVESAVRAGYTKKYADSQSYKLLDYLGIKTYIAERMAKKDEKIVADQNEILSFLTSVMRGEVKEQIPLLSGDGYQALENLDVTATKDRIKAAELLGKRHMMWTENKNITGNVSVTIVDDVDEE